MRITFLGTGHGIPEKDRRCSSAMLSSGGRLYFIDMGTMSVEDLQKMDLPVRDVRGIFITHMHGDHVNGLPAFADLCNWYFTDADPEILLPSEEGCRALTVWLDALEAGNRKQPLRVSAYGPGVIFDDGVLRVTAFKTLHTASSHALLCEAEGKKILFTGDLRRPAEDFPSDAAKNGLDVAVCETAHFPPEEYLPVWSGKHIKTAVLQHIQPRKLPLAEELTRRITDPRVLVAEDGMVLDL